MTEIAQTSFRLWTLLTKHDAVSEPLSWRDPDGFVVSFGGRILRAVESAKAEQLRELLDTPWVSRHVNEGAIPATKEIFDPPRVHGADGRWSWFEHFALPFPCYAHEITALQLYDAAHLTLTVALEAAETGWMLKDASAWNVLHSHGRPVFVDLLSFQRSDSTREWVAYGQFIRHFVLPLLLYRHLKLTPPDIFVNNRDGITPERAYQLLSGLPLLSARSLEFVVLPKWLEQAGGKRIAANAIHNASPRNAEMGRYLLMRTLRRLERIVSKLNPDKSKEKSVWQGYEEERKHYSEVDVAAKTDFVKAHVGRDGSVLDIGCNAGEFSLVAAERNNSVLSADFDHPALSRLYGRVRKKVTRLTPVMLNIGRPTPAIGWENKEVPSFIDRAQGHFDTVLMLGILHHLLVTERASLNMIVQLLVRLKPKRVITEWVDPEDPKFRQISGLNSGLYQNLKAENLEQAFLEQFSLELKYMLPCRTRVMYLWKRVI